MKALFHYKLLLISILLSGASFSNDHGKVFIYVDSNSKFSANDTSHFIWKEIKLGENISFGYNENATVWCKLAVNNLKQNHNTYWAFNNIHLDSILLYHCGQLLRLQGDRTRFKGEFLNAYTIEPIIGKDTVLIVAVKKQLSFIDFSVDLKKRQELLDETESSLSLFYIFIGVALLLLALNTYICWQTRSSIYLVYIMYSLLGIIYVAVNMGIAKYSFFPDFLYFSEFRIFSGCYWFLFLGIFLTKILDMQEYSPKTYKYLMSFQWIVAGLTVFAIVCLWTKAYSLLFIPSYIAYLIFFVNIVLLGFGVYRAYLQKHNRVKYIVLSFVPHIFWGLNMILSAFDFIGLSISKNWISIIILYEMLLFGWILIKEYVDSFKTVQLLQARVIAEEKKAIIEIEQTRLKERRMMAEILHDKVGINLARSIHLLELGKQEDVRNLIKDIGLYIRNLSHRILPKSLEMGALSASLREQLEHLNSEYKEINIRFSSYDFPETISSDRAFTIYLISLELIQNALKHASPKQITLELYDYPENIVLCCTDDGCGSDQAFISGFGLSSIERRLADMNGRMHISTDNQTGTCVLIEIPHENTH
jgi:signal transduction histidine kinase